MSSRRTMSAAVASLLFTYAAGVAAANLAPNPDFDTNLNGWPMSFGTSTFTLDATTGDPSPPSAHLVGIGGVASTCIVIDSSTKFDLSANIRLNSGDASVYLGGYRDATCSSPGSGPAGPAFSPNILNVWAHFSALNSAVPLGWQSVKIFLTSNGDVSDFNIDHIQFGPTTATPVKLQSFDVN